MTGRTALADRSLLDLVELLNTNDCQCGCVQPTHEQIERELKTRLTLLSDQLDLPGAVMEREPVRVLVLGDELPPGAWSARRILR